jgi:glycerol-3-phosphate acyltransferase PlsY
VIDGATAAGDAVLVAVALLGGYLVGSIPTGRLAGRDDGPGWTFLALTAAVATGVVPVAVGIVTWSWGIGWVAGLGAVLGACWPRLGRATGDTADTTTTGVATLGGAAFALAPPAGAISLVLAVVVLAIGGVVRRDARDVAGVVGFGTFAALFLAQHQDPVRLGALLALYLVVLVRSVTARAR